MILFHFYFGLPLLISLFGLNLWQNKITKFRGFSFQYQSTVLQEFSVPREHELLFNPLKFVRYRYDRTQSEIKRSLIFRQIELKDLRKINVSFALPGGNSPKEIAKGTEVELKVKRKTVSLSESQFELFKDSKVHSVALSFHGMSESSFSQLDRAVGGHLSGMRTLIIGGAGHKKQRIKRRKKNQSNTLSFSECLSVPYFEKITIAEFSDIIDIGSGELIKILMMKKGIMITKNDMIDRAEALQLLDLLGLNWREEKQLLGKGNHSFNEPTFDLRPPIVTVMGHVNHGKTTMLDNFRKTQIALSEVGGITQSLSILNCHLSSNRSITFIDTPGHAAFREMRKRGAMLTDIVLIVIAADDGIMDQTVECIDAALSLQCPIVVAINKIDKPGHNIDRIKTDLLNHGVVLEEFGGDVQCGLISAKTGEGFDDLLEKLFVQSEIIDLSFDQKASFEGEVAEASMDKKIGVVVTGMAKRGTLKVGDIVVAGSAWGKVRLLLNQNKEHVTESDPGIPFQIVGFHSAPDVGDRLLCASSEEEAELITKCLSKTVQQGSGFDSLLRTTVDDKFQPVPLIVKCDTKGGLHAILQSISNVSLSTKTRFVPILSQVGQISSSDVDFAAVSKAVILGFNVGLSNKVSEQARANNVIVKQFNILYELIDFLKSLVSKGIRLLSSNTPLAGVAEVKKLFKLNRGNVIGGCLVTEGKIKANSTIRVVRNNLMLHRGLLTSLKVVKEPVAEVITGSECGICVQGFNEIMVGDMIECEE